MVYKIYIIKAKSGLIGSVEKIRELCPDYDDSIDPNDYYRLEKGLRYAIASNGAFYSHRKDNVQQMNEVYDIRSFVLVTDPISMKHTIEKRSLVRFDYLLLKDIIGVKI